MKGTIAVALFLLSSLAHSQGTYVVRGAFQSIPGVIICQDLQTAEAMLRWYQNYQNNARIPENRRQAIVPTPDPESYLREFGCALIPNGTPVLDVDRRGIVPVVTFNMDGNPLTGVTPMSTLNVVNTPSSGAPQSVEPDQNWSRQ